MPRRDASGSRRPWQPCGGTWQPGRALRNGVQWGRALARVRDNQDEKISVAASTMITQ